MANMESFYAGRQGASFVIVKRFDGIDIPENSVYKNKIFAQDNSGLFYVPLIEKNSTNFHSYPNWGMIPCDGVTTVISSVGIESEPLPVEYCEGMRQCFSKGGDTTNEVNYGEYVIIDSIAGRGEFDNPDNGKVYRRGMNYDYNPVTNPLCGAEYIGQVIGPQGDSPEVSMGTIQNIINDNGIVQFYTPQQGDSQDGIVPGKYVNGQSQVAYNDNITYGYVTLRDNLGNVKGCLIGFTFPYLIPEFISSQRSPYYTQEDYNTGRISDANLIGTKITNAQMFELLADNGLSTLDRDPTHGDTGHAFYRKWKVEIPSGIKGDSLENLEVYPTKIIDGSVVYQQVDGSGNLSDPDPTPASNLTINLDNYENTKLLGYVEIAGGGYARLLDTWGLRVRYLITTYDNLAAGESNWIDIGEFNTITNINLSEDGWLTVNYSYNNPETMANPLRWIKYDATTQNDGIQIAADGTVSVTYNTLDGQGHNEVQTHPNLIPWITKTLLSSNGDFNVYFNNDVNKAAVQAAGGTWVSDLQTGEEYYHTHLKWIVKVTIDNDGIVHFWYNDNTEMTPAIGNMKIKYLDHVYIDTDGLNDGGQSSGYTDEGEGDQKVHLVFNTKDGNNQNETAVIGRPINYIVETAIVGAGDVGTNATMYHLLVYYSDPAYRQYLATNYPTKIKRYKGLKDTQPKDGWFDLGNVRGEPGGLHIIGDVTDPADLYDPVTGDAIPPEVIANNPECAGWAMTVTDNSGTTPVVEIYLYDYEASPNVWYSIGPISGGGTLVDPEEIIVVSDALTEPADLKPHGIWMVKDTIKWVE